MGSVNGIRRTFPFRKAPDTVRQLRMNKGPLESTWEPWLRLYDAATSSTAPFLVLPLRVQAVLKQACGRLLLTDMLTNLTVRGSTERHPIGSRRASPLTAAAPVPRGMVRDAAPVSPRVHVEDTLRADSDAGPAACAQFRVYGYCPAQDTSLLPPSLPRSGSQS